MTKNMTSLSYEKFKTLNVTFVAPISCEVCAAWVSKFHTYAITYVVVLIHFTEKSFHRNFLTETPFDRTPFDQMPFDRKNILPKKVI
jgi:hypothetical protein